MANTLRPIAQLLLLYLDWTGLNVLPLDIRRAPPLFIGGMAGITGRPTFIMYGSFVYVVTHKRVRGI